MTDRWTFGVEPLPQTVRAAARLRRVTSLVLSLEHPDPHLDKLIDALDEAERTLSPPADLSPRVGDRVDGRVYLDHSRHIGRFNPCVPEYEIVVDGDHAAGAVTFPVAYEGPPGIVHGGFLALFFDAAIQHHNCDVGVAGKTTALAVRYRRPAPVRTELRFTLARSVQAARICSTARLSSGDVVLCEAQLDAVKGERARLPAVSPRRIRP